LPAGATPWLRWSNMRSACAGALAPPGALAGKNAVRGNWLGQPGEGLAPPGALAGKDAVRGNWLGQPGEGLAPPGALAGKNADGA
jgi:hypothetical protein